MYEMKKCFSGKAAVVTGSAHGIGNCIKEEFENYGATVYVIDKAEGNHFIGDLSSKEVIEEFCHDVIKKSGWIDTDYRIYEGADAVQQP